MPRMKSALLSLATILVSILMVFNSCDNLQSLKSSATKAEDLSDDNSSTEEREIEEEENQDEEEITLPKRGAAAWIIENFKDVETTSGDFTTRQFLSSPHFILNATGTNSKYAFDLRDRNNANRKEVALVNVTITNGVSNDAHGAGFSVSDTIDTFMSNVTVSPDWPDWENYQTTNYDGIGFGSSGAIYGEDVTISDWNADCALDMKSQKGTQFVRLKAVGSGHYALRYWGKTKHYLVDSEIANSSTDPNDDIIQISDCEETEIYVYNSTFNGKPQLDREDIECNLQYPGGTPQIIYLTEDPRKTGDMHPMFSY